MTFSHTSVLLYETVDSLNIRPDGIYVDGTMGGGRQGAILWYFYVLWMVANVLYWCGWGPKTG